jgi:uncharacterized protein YbjT (DUF2867 family)
MGQIKTFITAITSIIMLAIAAPAGAAETNITNESKTILVAGATGSTGRHIVHKLLDRGYTVRAMSRSVERAAELGPAVEPIAADVTQPHTLPAALLGVDVVISAIGGRRPIGENGFKAVDFEGNRALIDAAKTAGIKRFLVITAGSAGRDGFLYRLPFGPYPWKARAEAHLRASGLDYTIVAPGGLKDEPGGQVAIAIRARANYETGPISREDVAEVIVTCLETDATIGKTLTIINQPELAVNDWRTALIDLPSDPS